MRGGGVVVEGSEVEGFRGGEGCEGEGYGARRRVYGEIENVFLNV